jgi:L-cysteine desulfidase
MPQNIEFVFPLAGLNEAFPASEQRQMTSGDLNNVRPMDTLASRMRGGQRPGLSKWGSGTQVGGATQPIVALCVVDSIK